MKLFINPGHGGEDPGAISASYNFEAIIVKEIANLLAEKLKKNGYSFELYQQKFNVYEVSKEENKGKYTHFISIHCNSAASRSAEGVEVLYCKGSKKGAKYAQIMQDELVKLTKLKDRGIKERSEIHVLKATKAPAILIELGFISNPKEERLMLNKPQMFANAIFEGIKKF